jgi:hypothetical protein
MINDYCHNTIMMTMYAAIRLPSILPYPPRRRGRFTSTSGNCPPLSLPPPPSVVVTHPQRQRNNSYGGL